MTKRLPNSEELSLAILTALTKLGGTLEFSVAPGSSEYDQVRQQMTVLEDIGGGRVRMTLTALDQLPPELIVDVLMRMTQAGRQEAPRHADPYRDEYEQRRLDSRRSPFVMTPLERDKYEAARRMGYPIDDSNYARLRESLDRFEYEHGPMGDRSGKSHYLYTDAIHRSMRPRIKPEEPEETREPVAAPPPTWTPPPVQRGDVGKVEAPRELE